MVDIGQTDALAQRLDKIDVLIRAHWKAVKVEEGRKARPRSLRAASCPQRSRPGSILRRGLCRVLDAGRAARQCLTRRLRHGCLRLRFRNSETLLRVLVDLIGDRTRAGRIA